MSKYALVEATIDFFYQGEIVRDTMLEASGLWRCPIKEVTESYIPPNNTSQDVWIEQISKRYDPKPHLRFTANDYLVRFSVIDEHIDGLGGAVKWYVDGCGVEDAFIPDGVEELDRYIEIAKRKAAGYDRPHHVTFFEVWEYVDDSYPDSPGGYVEPVGILDFDKLGEMTDVQA